MKCECNNYEKFTFLLSSPAHKLIAIFYRNFARIRLLYFLLLQFSNVKYFVDQKDNAKKKKIRGETIIENTPVLVANLKPLKGTKTTLLTGHCPLNSIL